MKTNIEVNQINDEALDMRTENSELKLEVLDEVSGGRAFGLGAIALNRLLKAHTQHFVTPFLRPMRDAPFQFKPHP